MKQDNVSDRKEVDLSPRERVEERARSSVLNLFGGQTLPGEITLPQLQEIAAQKKLAEFDAMVASSPTELIKNSLREVFHTHSSLSDEILRGIEAFERRWASGVKTMAVGMTEGKGDIYDPDTHKRVIEKLFSDYSLPKVRELVDNEFISLEGVPADSCNALLVNMGILSKGSTIEELMVSLPTLEGARIREQISDSDVPRGSWRDGYESRNEKSNPSWARVSNLRVPAFGDIRVDISKQKDFKTKPDSYRVVFGLGKDSLRKVVTPAIATSS